MSPRLCACGGSAGSTFYAAAIALVSVLLLGILQGILLAAIASIFLLLVRASQPNVAFLGRVPGTGRYADSARNPDVEPLAGVVAFRPEASLLYINAETVLDTVLAKVDAAPDIKLVVCGLSSSPFIDLAGAKMLRDLHGELASRGIAFQIVGARGQVRDVLQADGMAEKTDSANWTRRMDSLLGDLRAGDLVAAHGMGDASECSQAQIALTWIKRRCWGGDEHQRGCPQRRMCHVTIDSSGKGKRYEEDIGQRMMLAAVLGLLASAGVATPAVPKSARLPLSSPREASSSASAAGRAC